MFFLFLIELLNQVFEKRLYYRAADVDREVSRFAFGLQEDSEPGDYLNEKNRGLRVLQMSEVTGVDAAGNIMPEEMQELSEELHEDQH